MSTPLLSGAAALLFAAKPRATAAEVRCARGLHVLGNRYI